MTAVTVGDPSSPGRQVARLSHDAVEHGVFPRLRAVVEARPDAIAVIDATRSVTFRDLAAEAAQVLLRVRRALPPAPAPAPALATTSDGTTPAPVALLHDHDAAAVAAVFGVIASGHPLLVLDPRTPVPRLRAFAEQVGIRLVICDEANRATAQQVGDVLVLPVAPDGGAGATAAGQAGPAVLDDLWHDPPALDAPALLSFTSGSTGVPKVVEFAQRQIVGDAWDNSTAGGCYDERDVMAHTLPMAFNAGINVTTAGPLVGATMAMYDVRAAGIAGLPAWLARTRATVMHASPAILRTFVESGPDPALIRGVRSLTIAGEVAHGADVEAARRLFSPELTIYNRYGSSETGLISEFALRPGEPTPDGPLPAGSGVGLTRITLVDDAGAPVADGHPGTVMVHRDHLSIGYLGAPEASAAAFGQDADGGRTFRSSDLGRFDAEGRLHLLGRRDHSVKIRGYLVEPGEIDAVLFAMPEVREAVVQGRAHPADGRMRLVAYVVAGESRLNAAVVRARLREELPAHMVPESVVFLEALPRTERGKLDRAGLPEPPAVVPTSEGQVLDDWERILADVVAHALSLDDLGLDDDFFELGMDSLIAEAVMATVTGELGVTHPEATTTLLVQAPTVRQFAARLTRTPGAGSDVLIPVQPRGSKPPLFVVAGGGGLGVAFVNLARRLGPDQPVFALQARGLERRGVPDWTVAAMARRYVRHVRAVQPRGPYHLAGHSFGGLIALEMAHQLRARGAEVASLIVIDSFAPDPMLHRGREFFTGRSAPAQAKEWLGIAMTGLLGGREEQYWRFFRQSELLHRWHRGRPYDGRAVVLLAEDSDQRLAAQHWGDFLTGDWGAVDVSGDHISMLREPHVASAAEAVRDALRPRA